MLTNSYLTFNLNRYDILCLYLKFAILHLISTVFLGSYDILCLYLKFGWHFEVIGWYIS